MRSTFSPRVSDGSFWEFTCSSGCVIAGGWAWAEEGGGPGLEFELGLVAVLIDEHPESMRARHI
jgi:hypothetical protein